MGNRAPDLIHGRVEGQAFKDKGKIQSFDEARELSFSHWSEMSGEADRPENYHVVRYRLEPVGEKTKVTLCQFNEGKKSDIDAETKAEFTKNWKMMLDGLKKSAEGMH